MVCVGFCHVKIVTMEEASELSNSGKSLIYGSFEFTSFERESRLGHQDKYFYLEQEYGDM